MKITLLALFSFLVMNYSFAQDNSSDNLIRISTEKIDDYDFNVYYYVLEKNGLEVPDLDEYLKSVSAAPSLIFEVKNGENSLFGIMPGKKIEENEVHNYYEIINFASKNRVEMDCSVEGDINEIRAKELVKIGVDPKAKIRHSEGKDVLRIGKETYQVQNYEKLWSEAHAIAKQLISYQANSGNHAKKYIMDETIGGKLDFVQMLEEEKGDSVLMYKNAELTSTQYAIVLWGGAVHKLGINSFEDAVALWEDIYKRDMNVVEETMLREGYFSAEK